MGVIGGRLAGIAAVGLTLAACASTTEPSFPGAAANDLLSRILEEDRGAGVMAAVVEDGRVVWSGAVGSADLEQGTALRTDAKLRIGSVSKPLAAALALRMAMIGDVDLDADIRTYVPEAPARSPAITAKHLATHTSGVRHFDFANFLEANNVFYRATLADGIASFVNDPLLSPPGSAVHYSSHGYDLLGAALERAGGQSYATLFNNHVAGPFGLNSTMVDHPFDIIEGRARFYTVTAEYPAFGWKTAGALVNTVIRDGSDYYPSGGMVSNAEDLALFAARFFESDLIGSEFRKLSLEPARLTDGGVAQDTDGDGKVDLSFGWRIWRTQEGAVKAYGHDGETNGAYAFVRYYPEMRITIVAVANYNVVGRAPAFFSIMENDFSAIVLAD